MSEKGRKGMRERERGRGGMREREGMGGVGKREGMIEGVNKRERERWNERGMVGWMMALLLCLLWFLQAVTKA